MGNKSDPAMTREERLAAKLRENLRRRKNQGRAQSASPDDGDEAAAESGLSKAGPKS